MCDWKKVETEYVTTQKSYRALAEEFGVSRTCLAQQGKSRCWPEKRKAYQDDCCTKTIQKTAEKISEDQSELAASLNRSALKFAQRVHDKLESAMDIKPMDLLRLAQVWQILYDSIQKGEDVTEDQTAGIVILPGVIKPDA